MRCLIIFLIRQKLGLKRDECFRFTNQSSPENYYFFTRDALMKRTYCERKGKHWWRTTKSRASLNWLLDDECEIIKIEKPMKGEIINA